MSHRRRWKDGRKECRRVLKEHDMDFISCTPCMSMGAMMNRPVEILRWIKEHNEKAKAGKGTLVEEWVAIDDRPLLQENSGAKLEGHFVQTNPRQGLTQAVADQCIRILNGEEPPPKQTRRNFTTEHRGNLPNMVTENAPTRRRAYTNASNNKGNQNNRGAAAAITAGGTENSRMTAGQKAIGDAMRKNSGNAAGKHTARSVLLPAV